MRNAAALRGGDARPSRWPPRAGKRNGTREFIRSVKTKYPDRLTVRMNHLATRVILDANKRAIGVECWEGKHLYRADPNSADDASYREAGVPMHARGHPRRRRVQHAAAPDALRHRTEGASRGRRSASTARRPPGRRHEPAGPLRSRRRLHDGERLRRSSKLATFKPPAEGDPGDPCFEEWLRGSGVYTTNGAMAAVILRSKRRAARSRSLHLRAARQFPRLLPRVLQGHRASGKTTSPGPSSRHTRTTRSGTIRLARTIRVNTPEINFHYFDEGNDDRKAGGPRRRW